MSSSRGNIQMALDNVRSTKWRSLLTMLGVIIGIVSVVSIAGIGEGVKQQVSGQINKFGKDLITIRPGKVEIPEARKLVTNSDVLFGRTALSGLSLSDLEALKSAHHVSHMAPLGIVSGSIQVDGQKFNDNNTLIIATSPDLPEILQQDVKYGSFFDLTTDTDSAVIGRNVAHKLFGENIPLGRQFVVRGQNFTVRGIFPGFHASPFSPTANFDDSIFIPAKMAKQITNNEVQFYSILAKPDTPDQRKAAMTSISQTLAAAHGGEDDFSVLDQDKTIAMSSSIIDVLTTFTTAVAAIALLVGGIGIMNIMLVSVTERMHEIGIRKAVGATNRQILTQFVLEAVTLSVAGGVIGIAVSLLASFLLNTYTELKMIITWEPVVFATVVSVAVGVIFGAAPAIKAARKDPIEALRHE